MPWHLHGCLPLLVCANGSHADIINFVSCVTQGLQLVNHILWCSGVGHFRFWDPCE
jgi:hypothetical protein